MKPLLALFAIGLLGVGVSSCGGANKTTSSASQSSSSIAASTTSASDNTPTPDFTKVDKDNDNDYEAPADDTNNNSVLDAGQAASAPDKRAIVALVKRYYAAAAAEDGAAACSMLYTTIAETVPEDYGTSPPGPPYARGTTCPAVMTLIFKHEHRQLATKNAKLKVSRVRRTGEHQRLAVLSFDGLPERDIQVTHEGRTWKLEALLDSELP
jgi:hypothetical protein